MYSYTLYGFQVKSDVELPALPGSKEAPGDIFYRLTGESPRTPPEAEGLPWHLEVGDREIVLNIRDVGTFHILQGREIQVRCFPGVTQKALQVYLMGSALGLLLHQRGMLVLHASAIQFAAGAALFLGESGFGKSSIAAAMYMRGYTLIADDLAPVQLYLNGVWITAGFPRFKLYPEIAASLGIDPAAMHFLDNVEKKLGHWINERFATEALAVRCVFVLDKSAASDIEVVRSRETILELVRHSYPTRLLKSGGPDHFMKCAEIVKRVPIFRLRSFSSLPEIRGITETLERQFACFNEVAANSGNEV